MLLFYPKDKASNILLLLLLLLLCDWGHKRVLKRIYISISLSPEATITWTEMKWSVNIKLNMCIDGPTHSHVCT